ncbi:MAG TPA: FecR domain-containing protein [Longimicrobiales bacterium]
MERRRDDTGPIRPGDTPDGSSMAHGDELVVRFLQGEGHGSDAEEDVNEWRAASPANEARYRDIARVWARTAPLLDELRAGDLRGPERLLSRLGIGSTRGTKAASWRRASSLPLRWAAAIVVAACMGYALGSMVGRSGAQATGPELVTGAGERATIELADGSVVRLGPDSRLRLPPDPGRREVWLDGRAFFAIARQEGQSFRVRTRLGEALVLGTRFEIQVDERALEVMVVEGRVSLEAGETSVKLEAGEVGRVDQARAVEVTRLEDVIHRLDWTGDFLVFNDTPLRQVVIEVDRLFGAKIVVADSSLLDRTVTGWYAGTTFERTMEAICLIIGAHCRLAGDTAVVEP